ncbi:hypothetical protein B0H66DRAFT_597435 [Apodospora peruviana]|uniref:Uncharacterized protein n=1 Tax=Apodospora peruviana TaxID=516989 RepID=A0AAE0IRI6_9PEZI|nr:hypothetical protein B0H66DRAFT_597435 [Apodospora peruviana]
MRGCEHGVDGGISTDSWRDDGSSLLRGGYLPKPPQTTVDLFYHHKSKMMNSNKNTSGATGAAKTVTSTLGNTVGGLTNTVGGVVGAASRGIGETVTGATGGMGKPLGDGIANIGTGVEGGAASVSKGVKDAGEWKTNNKF